MVISHTVSQIQNKHEQSRAFREKKAGAKRLTSERKARLLANADDRLQNRLQKGVRGYFVWYNESINLI